MNDAFRRRKQQLEEDLGHPKVVRDCIFNDFQVQLLRWVAVEQKTPTAVYGGIGSGKTIALAQLVYFVAMTRPEAVILFGMNSSPNLKRITLPACRKVFGHVARWKESENLWIFPNGSEVELRFYDLKSTQDEAENPWEGRDVHLVVVDEAQSLPPHVLVHATHRARQVAYDRTGRRYRACIVINGRPGAVDWWPQAVREAGGYVLTPRTNVNHENLDENYDSNLRATMSHEEYLALTTGAPMPTKGRVYDNWSSRPWPEGNILHGWEYDPERPVVAAVDPGRRFPAVLFFQAADLVLPDSTPVTVNVVFDDLMPDECTTPELAVLMREVAMPLEWKERFGSRYRLDEVVIDNDGLVKGRQSGRSDVDILQSSPLEDFMPGLGVSVVWSTDPVKCEPRSGINRVRALVATGDGVRRLVCSADLWERGAEAPPDQRTFRKSIQHYAWSDVGRAGTSNPKSPSHGADALRYYGIYYCWLLTPAAPPPKLEPRRNPKARPVVAGLLGKRRRRPGGEDR